MTLVDETIEAARGTSAKIPSPFFLRPLYHTLQAMKPVNDIPSRAPQSCKERRDFLPGPPHLHAHPPPVTTSQIL